MKSTKLKPIKICSIQLLNASQLRFTKRLLPEIRTRKNSFGPDKNGQFHVVYCIINLSNKKCYFGKHTFNYNPKDKGYSDYHSNSTWLKNSMQKYGIKNFRMLILKYCKSSKLAYKYEEALITQKMLESKHCYNYQGGGTGFGTGRLNNSYLRVLKGTHHCLTRPDGTNRNTDKVKDGEHQWQTRPDGTNQNTDRVLAGTHNLLRKPDGSSLTAEINKIRVLNGTHNFIGIKPWNHHKATKNSKRIWRLADRIHRIYLEYPEYSVTEMCRLLSKTLNVKIVFNAESVGNMLDKFKSGWIPTTDSEWVSYKSSNVARA